jgi:hypothetical protein
MILLTVSIRVADWSNAAMNAVMTAALAALAILVPASVTLFGYWFREQSERRRALEKEQSEKRLAQERTQSEERLSQDKDQSEKRRALEKEQENDRLKLDAAMRAAELFGPSNKTPHGGSARCAAGLLALVRVDFAELAVALLVDLWSPQVDQLNSTMPDDVKKLDSSGVSTEIAIQVIDAALETCKPDAQVMAAELLCRNAGRLSICNSLHWPSSVNSAWIPKLPVTAKLLIVDALIQMALASEPTQNALRELAVRLYGISTGDPEQRVKGCIGSLMKAILPAVEALGFTDFMKGPGHDYVKITEMERVAGLASPHPDGYFEKIVEDRSEKLRRWSQECTTLSYVPTALAMASCARRDV